MKRSILFWHGTCLDNNGISHYPSSGPDNGNQMFKSYRGPFPRCQGPLKHLAMGLRAELG
jgi:hypothetical protein